MKQTITFEDLLKFVLENAKGNFIIWHKEKDRIEYNREEYYEIINKVSLNFRSKYPHIKEENWIGIKSDENCLFYIILFAALKCGWNVLLMQNDELNSECYKKDIELKVILDSSLFEDINLRETVCNLESTNDWGKKIALCSSGTTGRRQIFVYETEAILKQIKNTIDKIENNITLMNLINSADINKRKVVTFLPVSHILGFLMPLILIAIGFQIVFISKCTIYEIIEKIKHENALGSFGVPIIWRLLRNILNRRYSLDREGVDKLLGNNFKIIFSGGSKTDIDIRKEFIQMGINFFVGYGLTELGFLAMDQLNNDCIDTEGDIYTGYDFKILSKDGSLLNEGEGELLVKSDAKYSYILKNKNEEFPKLIKDRYCKTGDIFKLKDNKLFFKGRVKNIIVGESGENIYIEELEDYFSILKQKNIGYYIGEYKGEISIFIDESRIINDKMKRDVIALVREKNSQIIIYKKVRNIIFLKQGFGKTFKGDIIRRTEDILMDITNIVEEV